MLKNISLLITGLLFYSVAQAQQPDSTFKKSTVKTISDKQYNALLNGGEAYEGLALVATLNHNPLPDEVLKYKKDLSLSPAQVTKIAALATELHRKRVEMGKMIITNEQTLDKLLIKGADNGNIIFYTNRSGLYYGELRNAMLQACLSTGNLLAPQQIKKLETLQNRN